MSTTNPAAAENARQLHSEDFCYQLPFELEREICDIAASAFPKSIPKLVLIARRFRIWFEPELYRIIRSGHPRVIPPLYVASRSPDGSIHRVLDKARIEAFGPHVQHVLIQKQSPQEIVEILECCPNISNLALWLIQDGERAPLISILEKLPLRKLSIDPSALFGNYSIDDCISFNHPMFSNVTHLEILNCTSSWSKWEQLALLPRLTHLTLTLLHVDQEFIDCVLSECQSLELLIPFYEDWDVLDAKLEMPQEDYRVVPLEAIGDILEEGDDWENGARGKEDSWIKAEILKEKEIYARRCEAIEAAYRIALWQL